MGMHDNQYLLNNTPASAMDLIRVASFLDEEFGSDGIKTTSQAAQILRSYGHTVTKMPREANA